MGIIFSVTITADNIKELAEQLKESVSSIEGAAPAKATPAKPAKAAKPAKPAKPVEDEETFDVEETTDDADLDIEAAPDEPERTIKDLQAACQKMATKPKGKEKLQAIFKSFKIKNLKDLGEDDYADFAAKVGA